MLDVLFVHYGAPWLRGSENCLLELVTRLDRNCFRPRVLCNQEVLRAALEARGVEALRVELPEIMIDRSERRLELGAYLRTSRRILALARERRPALFYCNSGRAAQAAWLPARWLGVPRLCHIHAPFYRRYYWLWGLWDAQALVFPSEATGRSSLRPHDFAGRMRVIPNAVDLERFRPPLERDLGVRPFLGLEEDDLVIGQIGSLIPRKGVDVLLRALREMREKVPVRLLLAGSGDERPRLEALARELGVADGVRFLGEVRNPETLLQHAIDVNVLAAREECMPLTLIEAAACAKPTVCTRVGGNADVVVDGETGLLTPPGDPHALARAVLRLLGNAPLRHRLGAAARVRAEKRFGIDAFVAALEQEMRSLAASASSQGPSRPSATPPGARDGGAAPPRRGSPR